MTSSRPPVSSVKSTKWAVYITAGIIALVPFHAFLTVWLSSLVGRYTILRLWKEVLLVGLVGYVAYLLTKDAKLRNQFVSNRLNQLIFAYTVVTLLCGVIALALNAVTVKALGYGLVVNLRFLAFFLVVWVLAQKAPKLFTAWPHWLLWPLCGVLAFGFLQYFLLPYDFLKHFGYGEQTIFPYATINHNVADIRVFSTLRGANPFGAYLLLVLSVLAVVWRKQLNTWRSGVLVAGIVMLYLSFSRSAWIGSMLSAAIIVWFSLRSEKLKKISLIFASAGAVLVLATGFLLRDNTAFQNVIFHTNDNSSVKTSSNDGHASALKDGLEDIKSKPLGEGVGSAGPASVYNDNKVEISENYFIQIGQETGILGFGLFIAINALLAIELFRRRQDPLALGVFAALIGLSFVNLLSHAWADDTLAYIFWGLAGLALASPLKSAKKTV